MFFTNKFNLYPHQQDAVTWMMQQTMRYPSGGILAHDMGLGKTLDVCYYIANNERAKNGNNLIVVPNNIFKQWCEEFSKFIENIGANDFITYTTKKRNEYISNYRVVITTYDTLVSDYRNNRSELFSVEWSCIYIDEAHEIRNDRSVRNEAISNLKGLTKWCITGTPIWNSAKDLTTLKEFIDIDNAHLIDKSYIHIRGKEILTLPPCRVKEVGCMLTNKELTEYKKFEMKVLKQKLAGKSKGELFGNIVKLRIRCGSYMSDENTHAHSKLQKIKAILSTIPKGEKIVIFSMWSRTLINLQILLENSGYNAISSFHGGLTVSERQEELSKFRDGENNIMLTSIKCGGVGLNLICANHAILLEPQYSPFSEKQAIDRVYRIGQTKEVHVYRFYTKFTIEHWVNSVKDWKNVIKRVELDNSQEDPEQTFEKRTKLFQKYVLLKPKLDKIQNAANNT